MFDLKLKVRELIKVLPYALAGVLAPLLFTTMNNPHEAGRITGAFFILSGLYGIFLCRRWDTPRPLVFVFYGILIFEILFWGWRFFATEPLRDFEWGFITGTTLHGVASCLYLLGGVLLIFAASRTQRTRV